MQLLWTMSSTFLGICLIYKIKISYIVLSPYFRKSRYHTLSWVRILENQDIIHCLEPETKKNLDWVKTLNRAYIVHSLFLGSNSSWRGMVEPRLCGSTMPLYQIFLVSGFRDDVGPIYNSIFWVSSSNSSYTI